MKTNKLIVLLLIVLVVSAITSCQTSNGGGQLNPLPDNPAFTFVKSMGIGVNIGNTLDAINNHVSNTPAGETGWGNPLITKEFIQALKNHGYKTIRLPVTWAEFLGPAPDFTIDPVRMNRVEEVVKWIIDEDLYCILNLHHDGGTSPKSWILKAGVDPDGANRQFKAVWTQIANRFRSHSGKLILEAMNEVGFDNLWNRWNPATSGAKPEAFRILNMLNQTFVDTVRGTGSNNADRFMLVSGYWTDFENTADPLFKMPNDEPEHKLLLSLHYYTPATFCILDEDASWGKNRREWGSREDYKELETLFFKLREPFIDRGIPVILGEYGVNMRNKDEPSRVRWMTAVTQTALDNGMCPILWDTGGEIKRNAPYGISDSLSKVLKALRF